MKLESLHKNINLKRLQKISKLYRKQKVPKKTKIVTSNTGIIPNNRATIWRLKLVGYKT